MMQAYTEEQRKALIDRCKMISTWREKYGDYANVMLPAVEAKELAEIALEALKAGVHSYTFEEHPQPLYTAPPVAAPAVPDGWKLVPVIAFPSQWAAGQKAFDSAGMNKVDAVYKAMVAAAPEAKNGI